jgi:hypothetical protein
MESFIHVKVMKGQPLIAFGAQVFGTASIFGLS